VLSFTANDHGRVAAGEVTVSFRLWKYAHVKAGKSYATGFGGRVLIEDVELIPAAFVSEDDCRLAGHAGIEEAWRMAGDHTKTVVSPDTLLYRVQFRYLPEAPSRSITATSDLEAIVARLHRMDALSKHGAWTQQTLRLIDQHPLLVSREIMLMAGRDDLQSFKTDVRKLKALGLTMSHDVGYELTDLGRSVLQRL